MRIFKVRHANGHYTRRPELIKIFSDLQSMKFCLIIRYQQRLLLTRPWNLPSSLAVTLPAVLLMVSWVQYLIGRKKRLPQKRKARRTNGHSLLTAQENYG